MHQSGLKKKLLSALDSLIFSNLFISLGSICQALLTYHLYHLRPDGFVLLFLFCATFSMYNASLLLSGVPRQHTECKRLMWFSAHYQTIKYTSIISLIIAGGIFLFRFNLATQITICFVSSLSLGYHVCFIKRGNHRINLRAIPYLKIFIIALVWAMSTFLVPIVAVRGNGFLIFDAPTIGFFTVRFLFLVAITLPFDIRDMIQDNLQSIKTIPIAYGESNTQLICAVLLGLRIIILFFCSYNEVNILEELLTSFIAIWLIFSTYIKKDVYYYFFYLDGLLVLPFLLIYVF